MPLDRCASFPKSINEYPQVSVPENTSRFVRSPLRRRRHQLGVIRNFWNKYGTQIPYHGRDVLYVNCIVNLPNIEAEHPIDG